MNAKEVLAFAKGNGARQVDVRFTDIPGLQHHITYPISELSEDSLVCLDCGKEFDYNWKEMRVGEAVHAGAPARAESLSVVK